MGDYSENEDYEEYDVNELGDYLNDNYIQGDQFLFDHYQSANKPKPLTKTDVSPRMPKYVSPTKQIETELKIETPRNDKWMKSQEYRNIFGEKQKMARTPPFRGTCRGIPKINKK